METSKAATDSFRFGFGLPGLAHGFGSTESTMRQLARAAPAPTRLRDTRSSSRLVENAELTAEVKSAADSDRKAQQGARSKVGREHYQRDCQDRLIIAVESEYLAQCLRWIPSVIRLIPGRTANELLERVLEPIRHDPSSRLPATGKKGWRSSSQVPNSAGGDSC